MTTATHRILSQLGSFKSFTETFFVVNKGSPTASPINQLSFCFWSASVLKLFIATPDTWGTHQEPKKKRFFCKLQNDSPPLAVLPNRTVNSAQLATMTSTSIVMAQY